MTSEPLTQLHSAQPLEMVADWLEQARRAALPEPEAMALATVGPSGAPSVRMVLCRGIDSGGVVFYTNYGSRKGHELAGNARAACVFFWATFARQVRIEGVVEKVSAGQSDAYFHSRPRGSQLAACISPQSQPIEDIATLRKRQHALEISLAGGPVPRPPHWGGYRLHALAVELWKGGEDRLHERMRFERDTATGPWGKGQRLAP